MAITKLLLTALKASTGPPYNREFLFNIYTLYGIPKLFNKGIVDLRLELLSLKDEFINLLEKDREFRYAVAGLLGLEEILRRLDRNEQELVRLREDFNRLREDMNKLREDMNAGFKRHDEELAKLREDMNKLREDMNKGFRRYDEEIAKLREDMNRGFMLVERHISALGARWGLMAEEAFRSAVKGLVEEELGLKVERWTGFDEEGKVFGYPSRVEVDVAVSDGRIVLVEVKSHVGPSDVYTFKRKAELYEKLEGRKPARLLLVTPYAEEKALEAAKHLEIEVYTKV